MSAQVNALNNLNNSSALTAVMPAPGMMFDKSEQALTIALSTIAEQQRRINELENEAHTDLLTGLMNKRAFKRALEREQNRALRTGKPSAMLVMLDLDNMKAINDMYGHLAGDAYLLGFANALRRIVRGSDYIARLGGDEFVLLLTDIDITKGWSRVDDIMRLLNDAGVKYNSMRMDISVSHGGALVMPNMEADFIMGEADDLLYRCKDARKIERQQKNPDLNFMMMHD